MLTRFSPIRDARAWQKLTSVLAEKIDRRVYLSHPNYGELEAGDEDCPIVKIFIDRNGCVNIEDDDEVLGDVSSSSDESEEERQRPESKLPVSRKRSKPVSSKRNNSCDENCYSDSPLDQSPLKKRKASTFKNKQVSSRRDNSCDDSDSSIEQCPPKKRAVDYKPAKASTSKTKPKKQEVDPTVRIDSRKSMKPPPSGVMIKTTSDKEEESDYDNSSMPLLMNVINRSKAKSKTLTKQQTEFLEKYCKSNLSSSELESMKSDFISYTNIVLTQRKFLDTANEWAVKLRANNKKNEQIHSQATSEFDKFFTKISKYGSKLSSSIEKMEKNVLQFNQFFENVTDVNCVHCQIHCLPVFNSKFKWPNGRPLN